MAGEGQEAAAVAGGGGGNDGVRSLQEKFKEALADIRARGIKSPAAQASILAVVLASLGRSYWQAVHESPQVYCQRNAWTEAILSHLSKGPSRSIRNYYPGLLVANGHLSTIFGFARSLPRSVPCSRELVLTDDGGHYRLDWFKESIPAAEASATTPIVLLLHGVNGHGDESYMRHLAHTVAKRGWRAVAMTFRGCGDLGLTSIIAYNASRTDDIHHACTTISSRFPHSPLFLVGFSLGANLMVKYLGERAGDSPPIRAAVSVSNPWCFLPHVKGMHTEGDKRHGFNLATRFYSFLIAFEYKKYIKRHKDILWQPELWGDADPPEIDHIHTIRELDEKVTAPVWGYRDAEHYFTESSSSEVLDKVKVPLLGINALNDPFVHKTAIDHTILKASLNPLCILVTTRGGGHIGWGEALSHLWQASWAERLCVEYFDAVLQVGRPHEDGDGKAAPQLLQPHARL